jgi:multidrug efflux pump subunit AcrA (membrane-fusion protein)
VDEETMLRIAQVDPLRVEVILPSQLFGRVRPGDLAEIVPEPPLDQARRAEVSIVDPLIDGPSGTFGARLLLPNPDRDLPAGLRCQVRFLGDAPEEHANAEESEDLPTEVIP